MNTSTRSGERQLANPVRLYWDSCAWLALINREPARLPDVDAIYSHARRGNLELWTSTLSIVEANRLTSEVGRPKPIPSASLATIDRVLSQPFVKPISLDIEVAKLARKLVRETPRLGKKADAIHLAAAIKWNIPTFHTYDNDDLLHLNGKITCSDGSPMLICEPVDPFSGGLFGNASQPPAA